MPDEDGGLTLESPDGSPVGGMPTGPQVQQQVQQQAPTPDLSQPLLQDDGGAEDESGAEDGDELEGEDEQPRGRRSLVGDLVRERERRQTVETNLQQSQHLLQQVMSLPGGMELLQAAATGKQPQRTAPGQPTAEDQELMAEAQEVAQDLGLYDAEGKADLRTAARIVLRDRKRTQQMLAQAIQPLQRTTMGLAAQPVIAHVLSVADQFGIDRNLVLQGLQATPPEHINNVEVQQAVLMMALGTQTMLGQQQGEQQPPPTMQQQIATQLQQQPPTQVQRAPRPGQFRGPQQQRSAMRPPIFSEGPGGRPRASAPQLDSVFRDRLKSTGMKDADIDGAVGRFVPGAPNRLE